MLFDDAFDEFVKQRGNAARKFRKRYWAIIEKYSKPVEKDDGPLPVYDIVSESIIFEPVEPPTHSTQPLPKEASLDYVTTDFNRSSKPEGTSVYVTPRQNYSYYSKKCLSKKKWKARQKFYKTPTPFHSRTSQNRTKLRLLRNLIKYFYTKTPTPGCVSKIRRVLKFSKAAVHKGNQFYDNSKKNFSCDKELQNCSSPKKPLKNSLNVTCDENTSAEPANCYIDNEENENVAVLVDDDKSDYFEVDVCDGISQCSSYSTASKSSKLIPNSDKQVGNSDSNYLSCDEVSLLSFGDVRQSWSTPIHLLENRKKTSEDVELRVADWCKTVDHSFPESGLPTDYKDECHDDTRYNSLNEQPQLLRNEPSEEYIQDDEVIFLTLEDSFEDLPSTSVGEQDRTEASDAGISSELESRTCSSTSKRTGHWSPVPFWSTPLHLLKNRKKTREDVELHVADWCKTVNHSFPESGLPTDYKDKCHDDTHYNSLKEQPQPLRNEPPEEYIQDDEVIFLTLDDSFEDLPSSSVDEQDSDASISPELELRTCSSTSSCSVLLHYNAEQAGLYKKFGLVYT